MAVNRGQVEVLSGVSLSVKSGKWIGLIGPNGSGKSTLLSAIARLLPYSGSIVLDGGEVRDWSIREFSKRLAFVRQSTPLLFDFSVEELVLLGASPHRGLISSYTNDDRQKAAEVLSRVDLAQYQDRSVMTLSGGERQRVFLAQALLQNPKILLMDEPTAHLDVHHQFNFLEMVKSRVSNGLTTISAFHDLELAARFADSIIVLDKKTLVANGSPADILTADLLRDVFRMEAETEIQPDGALRIQYSTTA